MLGIGKRPGSDRFVMVLACDSCGAETNLDPSAEDVATYAAMSAKILEAAGDPEAIARGALSAVRHTFGSLGWEIERDPMRTRYIVTCDKCQKRLSC